MHALASCALIVLLAPLPAALRQTPARATAPKDAAAEFQSALDLAQRMMQSGKWTQAKKQLVDALAAHDGADYAVRALYEIEQDLQRCTFWSTHTRPKPKDVVEGELVSYNAASGDIKLRYRREKGDQRSKERRGRRRLDFAQDFLVFDDVYVHPLVFTGPYSLEIKGPALGRSKPSILMCIEEDGYFVAFPGDSNLAFQVQGTERTNLGARRASLDANLPYRIKVQVFANNVSISHNNNLITEFEKPKDVWGQLGFFGFPDVEEIVVAGEVEPAWIDGLIDSAIQREWAAFEKTYDFKKDLPTLLRERIEQRELPAEDFFTRAPGPEHPQTRAHLEHLKELFAKRDVQSSVKWIRSLKPEDITEPLLEWLWTLVCAALGDTAEACAHAQKVSELDPAFFPARAFLTDTRVETQSLKDSLAACRALVAAFPREPGAYASLVSVMLMAGLSGEASALLDQAARESLASKTLDGLRATIARALKGPDWGRANEYVSEHYEVRSDLSGKLCFEANQALETMYKKLDVHLRHIPSERKARFRVFLFSGRSGYHAYAQDVLGGAPENTAGVYSQVLKQLLIWNLPERDDMMRTVRHEGFHQYFDQIVDHSPAWMDEGLAEYYEQSRRIRGRWEDGVIQSGHVARLHDESTHLVSLAQFLSMDAAHFYRNATFNYAEAWAFIHFLMESGAPQRKRFDTLLDALIAGTSTPEALAQAFPAADLPVLDREFAAYVAALSD